MSKRWLDTGCLRAKPQEVDTENGIIKGVKVCTAGEAKGHGVHLDSEFIETVTTQGNAAKRGLKARFGHPNMCSEALGTYIGRFRNFSMATTIRQDGTEAATCIADLHLSETAKDTPNGDLYGYIQHLAEKEADMFGSSIVFIQGSYYRRNEAGEKVYPYDDSGRRNEEYKKIDGPDYVECQKLMACDCVDEPAANDGLFSAFAGETVAGQITEFFDLHPQIFELLNENQEIMDAIVRYGDKFDEFFHRYQEHRGRSTPPGEYQKPTAREAEMADKIADTTKETKETKNKETPENPEKQGSREARETLEAGGAEEVVVDLDAAVEAALAADRKRQADIREIGRRFGFMDDAEKFAADGRSVEKFRAHILNKSPEEWRASLSIKNPSLQQSEQDYEDYSEGDSVVATIKKRRSTAGR